MNSTLICLSLVVTLSLGASLVNLDQEGEVAAELEYEADSYKKELKEIDTGAIIEIDSVESETNPYMKETKNIDSNPYIEATKNMESEVVSLVPEEYLNCTITDYYCNPSGDDLIERVNDPNIMSAKDCHDVCL